MKYKVLRDTREQLGWTFSPSKNCEGMVIATLPTGDYTIEGFETQVVIERKGSVAEFATNVFQKRFEQEMERLESFAFPFVVLEFTMADVMAYPNNCGIPESKKRFIKVSPFLLLKRITELQLKYKTKFIFAGAFGKETAASIFKRVIEKNEQA